MSQDITASILKFVRDLDPSNARDSHLDAQVDLFDGGYLDSFGIVELIEFIIREFKTDFSNADFYAGSLRTVAGIAATIAAKQSA